MRYVLYQANEQQVDLKKEIDFAKNYVDLQRIRYQDKYKISFEVTGQIDEQKVAPLLFIDFIENAFKHGLERRFNDGFVAVKFNIEQGNIMLNVINSKGQNDEDLPSGNIKRKGIGLQNVQRRLDLIYGESHQLKITETEEIFEITLSLQLS
jgi:LytS/YehU family sensor histidine kinase